MKHLVETILEKKYDSANQIFQEEIQTIQLRKLNEAKKAVAAKMGVSSFQSALDEDVEVSRNLEELDVSREKPETKDVENRDAESQSWPIGPVDMNYAKGAKKSGETVVNKSTASTRETVIPKNNLKEEETLDEARVKLIKARIRGGKIQRRKKVSNVKGYTLRGGKLKRMSAAERRRRKLGQKRGKIKRRTKMRQTLMKRKRSLRKRASIGL